MERRLSRRLPRLSIKVRDELVTLEPSKKFDVFDRGTPLRPKAWHEHLTKNPDALIIDARNDYESGIEAEFRAH